MSASATPSSGWDPVKEPMTVSFRDLSYHVMIDDPDAKKGGPCLSVPKIQKTIIDNISGAFLKES
jgi:hypothetical protein